jgi:hypothetical protein
MRGLLRIFAEEMERKLKTKDEEHGEAGWLNGGTTVRFLKDRLTEEMRELYSAFDDCNKDELLDECLDVANFAMMIHSRLLDPKREPPKEEK